MNRTLLRAAVADSRLLGIAHSLQPARPVQPKDDTLDRVLIQLANSSVPVRGLSRLGEFLRHVWQQSICATRVRQWVAEPAAARLKLISIAAAAAVLTHIALTGFSAPEPTTAARAGWIGVLLLLALTAIRSGAIVTAWMDWTARRGAHAHEIP